MCIFHEDVRVADVKLHTFLFLALDESEWYIHAPTISCSSIRRGGEGKKSPLSELNPVSQRESVPNKNILNDPKQKIHKVGIGAHFYGYSRQLSVNGIKNCNFFL